MAESSNNQSLCHQITLNRKLSINSVQYFSMIVMNFSHISCQIFKMKKLQYKKNKILTLIIWVLKAHGICLTRLIHLSLTNCLVVSIIKHSSIFFIIRLHNFRCIYLYNLIISPFFRHVKNNSNLCKVWKKIHYLQPLHDFEHGLWEFPWPLYSKFPEGRHSRL